MSLPHETTRAFLLRSVDRGEADRLLTFYTEHRGKIAGIARSARRSTRRFGGALEPFALMELTIAPTRRALYQIKRAAAQEAHLPIARDLGKTWAAASVLEIVREATADNQPDPALFALVAEAIRAVAEADAREIRPVWIASMLQLLALAGLAVQVAQCHRCGRPVPEGKKAMFHPAQGGVVCSACGGGPRTLSREAASAVRKLARLRPSEAAGVVLEDEAFRELHGALVDFAEYQIGRPLRTCKVSPEG